MAGTLTAIVVDALDVRGLAAFWAEALRWRLDGAVVRPPAGGLELRFTPTIAPKDGKNRLHLDLAGSTDEARQRAEVARLCALGAEPADIGQGDVTWDVLADPEGNELCVLPRHRGEPGAALVHICLDAADVAAQCDFWAEATGWAVAERGDWGVSLREPAGGGPALVMGPPAARKSGRNRLRPHLTALPEHAHGLLADPEGNEFEVG